MRADAAAVGRFDRAGLGRQIAAQELGERPFADEADARAVLLVGNGQSCRLGKRPHFTLGLVCQGKQHAVEVRAGDGMQEVALILAGIAGLQEPILAVLAGKAGVVARCDAGGAEASRVVEQRAEFDLAIAEHVRIRRSPGSALAQKVRKHPRAVFAGEADAVQRHAEQIGDAPGVLKVRRGLAIAVVFPVAHVQALHVVAGVEQQGGGDG
jgi:hypothetical protein